MKPWRTAFLVPSLLALAGSAGAQPQGPVPSEPWTMRQARLIVSAERLFGVHAYSASYEPAEGDATQVEGAMVSLLYGQSAINDGSDSVNPYAVPRIGVDGVLGGAFTIGGSVGFGATTGNIDNGAESGSTSLPAASGFTVYGRFGYLIVPSATVAVWLRAGPEFFSGSYDNTGSQVEYTTKVLALTTDPQLVITPVPHAAILVGTLIDIGVWGSYERTRSTSSEQVDFTISNLGVTAGLALIF